METEQGLTVVEDGLGMKRSTFVGIHLQLKDVGKRQCEWLEGIRLQKELAW